MNNVWSFLPAFDCLFLKHFFDMTCSQLQVAAYCLLLVFNFHPQWLQTAQSSWLSSDSTAWCNTAVTQIVIVQSGSPNAVWLVWQGGGGWRGGWEGGGGGKGRGLPFFVLLRLFKEDILFSDTDEDDSRWSGPYSHCNCSYCKWSHFEVIHQLSVTLQSLLAGKKKCTSWAALAL